jgi:hypothetical protein
MRTGRKLENTPPGRTLIQHRFWLSALYCANSVVTPDCCRRPFHSGSADPEADVTWFGTLADFLLRHLSTPLETGSGDAANTSP